MAIFMGKVRTSLWISGSLWIPWQGSRPKRAAGVSWTLWRRGEATKYRGFTWFHQLKLGFNTTWRFTKKNWAVTSKKSDFISKSWGFTPKKVYLAKLGFPPTDIGVWPTTDGRSFSLARKTWDWNTIDGNGCCNWGESWKLVKLKGVHVVGEVQAVFVRSATLLLVSYTVLCIWYPEDMVQLNICQVYQSFWRGWFASPQSIHWGDIK